MNASVAGSSSWPGERNTSCTIGGTVSGSVRPAAWRCNTPCFSRHSSHSPPAIVWLPQSQLRCNTPPVSGFKLWSDSPVCVAASCLIYSILRMLLARSAFLDALDYYRSPLVSRHLAHKASRRQTLGSAPAHQQPAAASTPLRPP